MKEHIRGLAVDADCARRGASLDLPTGSIRPSFPALNEKESLAS